MTISLATVIADDTKNSDLKWLTDFESAKQASKKTGKPILIEFSGSDWCVPCIRLEKQVFKQEPFIAFARHNLVLLYCDLPYRKKISKELKAQNEALAEQYHVKIYPTVVMVDSAGEIFHREDGYQGDPGEVYVDKLQKALRKHGKKTVD